MSLEKALDMASEATAGEANLRSIIERARDALIWCSGSQDFGEGGQAREGWLKDCRPLINEISAILDTVNKKEEEKQ